MRYHATVFTLSALLVLSAACTKAADEPTEEAAASEVIHLEATAPGAEADEAPQPAGSGDGANEAAPGTDSAPGAPQMERAPAAEGPVRVTPAQRDRARDLLMQDPAFRARVEANRRSVEGEAQAPASQPGH